MYLCIIVYQIPVVMICVLRCSFYGFRTYWSFLIGGKIRWGKSLWLKGL